MSTRNEQKPRIRAPAHLSRAEKRTFQDLIQARSGADRPIPAAKVDAIADYVSARSRIRELTKTWRAAVRREGDYAPNERHAAALCRQIDATTALCRRIAAELDLPDPHAEELP